MVQYGYDGFPIETTYWDTDICKDGYFYLMYNMDKYFLFIPAHKYNVLKEMETALSIVITRGSYNGKPDYFEIMFDDNSDNPYRVMLEDEQFSRLTPLQEGWNGSFYIYSGSLEEYSLSFNYVYYHVNKNLPCMCSADEPPSKLHNLTPLSRKEAITAMKAGERLVNGVDNYDAARYHWYENHILSSDSYYDQIGEGETIPENELPQLYRIGKGKFGNMTDHSRSRIKPLFESDKYPLLKTKFDLEKLTEQIVNICSKTGRNVNNLNFEIILNTTGEIVIR
jgi:hypothetical protein